MEFNLKIVHARDFVRVVASGDMELEATSQMLLKAGSLPVSPAHRDIFVDCRQATAYMPLADVTKVVEAMIDQRRAFAGKLALLCTEGEGLSVMKFMETFARNRGLNITAFGDYEPAINWLLPGIDVPPIQTSK